MKIASFLVVLICLQSYIERSRAVPARTSGQVLLGEVDIALHDEKLHEITTEEPLLKKCIVNGNAYSHSETIPSYEANSHCLCVAGEVYCWWQNYNFESSMGSSSLRSTTLNSNDSPEGNTGSAENPMNRGENPGENAGENPGEASEEFRRDRANSSPEKEEYIVANTTYTVISAPRTCIVMGREYHKGEVLPHSTGNCVECSCGSEGRVECSPRDCVALRPEMPVVPGIPEAPDSDFEVFNLGRDRGIDESF